EQEALQRAVELAPKVREELGRAWLVESFTARPERGREVLAAIGAAASRGLVARAMDPDARQKTLELQKTAVEALLDAAPGQSPEWRRVLTLLAGAWLTEAEFTHRHDQSTSLGPRLQRDPFGNIYYVNTTFEAPMPGLIPQPNNLPRPIP